MGYRNFQNRIVRLKLMSAYIAKIISIAFIFQAFVFAYLLTNNLKKVEEFNLKIYAKSIFKAKSEPYTTIKQEQEVILIENGTIPLILSFGTYILIFGVFYFFARKDAEAQVKEARGAKLVRLDELVKSLKAYKDKYITIGGFDKKTHILTEGDNIALKLDKAKEMSYREHSIDIPQKFEYTHFCILGKSGSGKTSLINPVVEQIRERGDRMIIHDYKGDFTKNFCKVGKDLIFNPTTPDRCVKWSVFNDINSKEDMRALAHSLIPAPFVGEDAFWKNASRDILTGCLMSLFEGGKKSNKDIYELVTSHNATIEEALRSSVSARKYAYAFDPSNQKTLNSLMSVFRTYTSCFEYLADIDGDFSVREWVKNSSKNIFVQNRENIKEAISPALTLFIDTISRELLSHNDRTDKTIFVLDEFGRLNKMSSVLDLLTNGRSKGASVYILAQEFAQIEAKYGKEGRKTIVNACSNQIYFGINDAESAKEISAQIGQEEKTQEDESIHHKTQIEDMEGLNVRRHQSVKSVVLPSEILNLKEREFYIKLNGLDWCKSKVFIKKL